MKNSIGKMLKICLSLLLCLALSGCWNSRELDSLAIVMGYAIDKSDEEGLVDMTAQVAVLSDGGSSDNSSSSSNTASSEAYWNITRTGSSIFTILRDYTHESSRKLYSPHNQVIIFGNDLAKNGIRDYLDFFLRDHETRLNVWILVAKDKASDILDVKPKLEKIPAIGLSDLIEDQKATSETVQIRIRDFLERLISDTTASIAPLVEVIGEGKDQIVEMSGTAVFKQDKLVGELNKTETRGLLWVLSKVNSGIITVEAPGGTADLEIVSTETQVNVEILDDGSITAHVKITESGNIGSQTGSGDLSKTDNVKILEQNMNDAITAEVFSAVEKAKELDADIFGFGDMFYKKYPQQWKSMKENWDELFNEIKVEVEVDAKLRGSGRIVKPAYPAEEE